jgi:hypothetical protein
MLIIVTLLFIVAVAVAWKRSPRFRRIVEATFWFAMGLPEEIGIPPRPYVQKLLLRAVRRIVFAYRSGVYSERQLPTTALVRFNPADYDLVKNLRRQIREELEMVLARRGRQPGNRLLATPSIEITADGDVWRGWPRVTVEFASETVKELAPRRAGEPIETKPLGASELEPVTPGLPSFLLSGTFHRIGRSSAQSDLVVSHTRVSRTHAYLYLEDGKWWVEDAGSSNGTFVNGEAVTDQRPLGNGDTLRLGQEVTFRLRAEADTVPLTG